MVKSNDNLSRNEGNSPDIENDIPNKKRIINNYTSSYRNPVGKPRVELFSDRDSSFNEKFTKELGYILKEKREFVSDIESKFNSFVQEFRRDEFFYDEDIDTIIKPVKSIYTKEDDAKEVDDIYSLDEDSLFYDTLSALAMQRILKKRKNPNISESDLDSDSIDFYTNKLLYSLFFYMNTRYQ